MKSCKTCAYVYRMVSHDPTVPCEDCDNHDKWKSAKQTNADRIREMTDEELDKFLGEVQWDVANYCGGVTQKQEYPVPEHRGAWIDWLRQEAEA